MIWLDETKRLLGYPFGDERLVAAVALIGDLARVQDPSVAEITRDRVHLSANGGGGPEEAFGSYREAPVV